MLWTVGGLLIRSGLILAAAELLRRMARRPAAAYRHRIVLAGFALLLCWPLCSALLPEISLPLWKTAPVLAKVTVEQTVTSLAGGKPEASAVNWPLAIWLAGVLLALAPVAIGYIKVRRIAGMATPFEDDRWQALLAAECSRLGTATEARVRVSRDSVVPFAFGFARPQIILPAGWADWPILRQRTVLLHELAHVKRRDLLWQLFANIMTALWWFQPLCWWMRSSLRRESEKACDELVLQSGVRASDYASELLAIAQDFSTNQPSCSAAIAMARRGELEGRLYAILDSRPKSARRLPVAATAVLTAMTLSASAVTISPNPSKLAGGYQMRRTVLTGLLASAGLYAATIGGSVFDPGGTAIPNAQVSLYNPDTSAKQETTTAADGKFAFESLGAGSYILRLEKPGFDPLYREFNVKEDSDVQRGLVLKIASKGENKPGHVAEAQPLNPKLLRVGGALEESNLTRKVQPVYPVPAKEAGIQGTVELDVTISKEGVPEDIRVLSSPSDDLTQSSLEAVRQWRYKPMLLNGEPVEIVTEVIVNYTLTNK